MRLLNKIGIILDRINEIFFHIAGVLSLLMMTLLILDIIFRTLEVRMLGILEIIELGLVYYTFIGAAYLIKRDGHIRMDLIINYFKPRARAIINTVVYIVSTLIWLTVMWYSTLSTLDTFKLGSLIQGFHNIPKFSILLIIPICSLLMAIETARKAFRYLNSARGIQTALVSDKAGIVVD